MNLFLYPSADATIYKHPTISNLNTGLDEILEVENTYDEVQGHHVSRFLIKFDLDESAISNDILLKSEYFLNLKITESLELRHESELQIFPVVNSWKEGSGRRYDTELSYEGVTWKLRKTSEDSWVTPGGVWYSYEESSQGNTTNIGVEHKFAERTSDISLDITDMVKYWIGGAIQNNGLIVKLKDESTKHQGKVSFFSKDTNTIYSPYLKICHNDYYFNPCECLITESITCLYSGSVDDSIESMPGISGSLAVSGSIVGDTGVIHTENTLLDDNSEESVSVCDLEPIMLRTKKISESTIKHITSEDIVVTLKGLKSKISVTESMRIKIGVRDKYPQKTFSSHSDYTSNNYVEYPMYYSVRDADTHEVRIPFGKYSRISCDAAGHYFDFDFGCLSIGRIYEFLIRVETPSQTIVHPDKIKFMVIV